MAPPLPTSRLFWVGSVLLLATVGVCLYPRTEFGGPDTHWDEPLLSCAVADLVRHDVPYPFFQTYGPLAQYIMAGVVVVYEAVDPVGRLYPFRYRDVSDAPPWWPFFRNFSDTTPIFWTRKVMLAVNLLVLLLCGFIAQRWGLIRNAAMVWLVLALTFMSATYRTHNLLVLPNVLVSLLMTLVVLLLLVPLERRGRRWSLLVGFLFAVVLNTKGTGLIILPLFVLSCFQGVNVLERSRNVVGAAWNVLKKGAGSLTGIALAALLSFVVLNPGFLMKPSRMLKSYVTPIINKGPVTVHKGQVTVGLVSPRANLSVFNRWITEEVCGHGSVFLLLLGTATFGYVVGRKWYFMTIVSGGFFLPWGVTLLYSNGILHHYWLPGLFLFWFYVVTGIGLLCTRLSSERTRVFEETGRLTGKAVGWGATALVVAMVGLIIGLERGITWGTVPDHRRMALAAAQSLLARDQTLDRTLLVDGSSLFHVRPLVLNGVPLIRSGPWNWDQIEDSVRRSGRPMLLVWGVYDLVPMDLWPGVTRAEEYRCYRERVERHPVVMHWSGSKPLLYDDTPGPKDCPVEIRRIEPSLCIDGTRVPVAGFDTAEAGFCNRISSGMRLPLVLPPGDLNQFVWGWRTDEPGSRIVLRIEDSAGRFDIHEITGQSMHEFRPAVGKAPFWVEASTDSVGCGVMVYAYADYREVSVPMVPVSAWLKRDHRWTVRKGVLNRAGVYSPVLSGPPSEHFRVKAFVLSSTLVKDDSPAWAYPGKGQRREVRLFFDGEAAPVQTFTFPRDDANLRVPIPMGVRAESLRLELIEDWADPLVIKKAWFEVEGLDPRGSLSLQPSRTLID